MPFYGGTVCLIIIDLFLLPIEIPHKISLCTFVLLIVSDLRRVINPLKCQRFNPLSLDGTVAFSLGSVRARGDAAALCGL